MSRRKKTSRKSFFTPAVPVPAVYPAPQQLVPYPPDGMPYTESAVPDGLTVQVQLLSAPDATVAKAVLSGTGHPYSPVASVCRSSKREPGDAYDPEIGTLYATARALHALAGKMTKHADGLVRHAESNRRQRAAGHPDGFRDSGGQLWADGTSADFSVHLQPGMTEEDVPDEVKEMIRSLWPDAAVSYTTDETSDLPAEIARVIEETLGYRENGVRSPQPGKHARDEGDNAPIDPDLLEQGQ